jgi:hypothetical protein
MLAERYNHQNPRPAQRRRLDNNEDRGCGGPGQ